MHSLQLPQQYTAQSIRYTYAGSSYAGHFAVEIEDACLILKSLPAHHLLAAE